MILLLVKYNIQNICGCVFIYKKNLHNITIPHSSWSHFSPEREPSYIHKSKTFNFRIYNVLQHLDCQKEH